MTRVASRSNSCDVAGGLTARWLRLWCIPSSRRTPSPWDHATHVVKDVYTGGEIAHRSRTSTGTRTRPIAPFLEGGYAIGRGDQTRRSISPRRPIRRDVPLERPPPCLEAHGHVVSSGSSRRNTSPHSRSISSSCRRGASEHRSVTARICHFGYRPRRSRVREHVAPALGDAPDPGASPASSDPTTDERDAVELLLSASAPQRNGQSRQLATHPSHRSEAFMSHQLHSVPGTRSTRSGPRPRAESAQAGAASYASRTREGHSRRGPCTSSWSPAGRTGGVGRSDARRRRPASALSGRMSRTSRICRSWPRWTSGMSACSGSGANWRSRSSGTLRALLGDGPHGPVDETIRSLLLDDDGPSLSAYMEVDGTLAQMREFVVHRSAYQLKEADGHTFGHPPSARPGEAAARRDPGRRVRR